MLNDTVRLVCEKTQLLLNQVQLGYECYMFYFLHVIYHKKNATYLYEVHFNKMQRDLHVYCAVYSLKKKMNYTDNI